jgi:hypothetical protein
VRFKRFCIGALTAAALGITASPAAGAPTARPPGDGPDGPVVLSGRSRGSIVASVTAVGATTSAFPVLSATLSPMSLDGFGYSDSVNYPLVRNVSFVARTTDASFPVGGSGGGKPGAVREFLRWVCRLGATHVGDSNIQTQPTPRRLDLQITGAIQRAGFNPTVRAITSGTSTFGRCRGK